MMNIQSLISEEIKENTGIVDSIDPSIHSLNFF